MEEVMYENLRGRVEFDVSKETVIMGSNGKV